MTSRPPIAGLRVLRKADKGAPVFKCGSDKRKAKRPGIIFLAEGSEGCVDKSAGYSLIVAVAKVSSVNFVGQGIVRRLESPYQLNKNTYLAATVNCFICPRRK